MVNTIMNGTYRQTNLTNESAEYLAEREELRLAEIELMRQRELVAGMRRNLRGIDLLTPMCTSWISLRKVGAISTQALPTAQKSKQHLSSIRRQ
jgi:hypothetical protein